MAEHLINIITLKKDFTSVGYSAFNVGDRVRNYWDDAAGAIKTYLENNAETSGGDLSAWGDSGTFEDVAANWGGAEYESGSLSRSSVQAHTGTYSALYTDQGNTNIRIIQQRIESYTVGNTYNITARVFLPSGNPLFNTGTPADLVFVMGTKLGGYYTVTMYGDPTVWAYDTWIELQGRLTVIQDAAPSIYPTAVIKLVGAQANTGGLLYIDQFKIIENTGFTSGDVVVTAGPNLGTLDKSQVQHYGNPYDKYIYECGYKFCEGTTLNTFEGTLLSPSFPYISRVQAANHASCTVAAPACDLVLNSPVITNATDQFTNDGSVQGSATSSRAVRYLLGGVDEKKPIYLALTNTTGLFSNLYPGTYKLWAVDAAQCGASQLITIAANIINAPQPTVTATYSEKYRMQFDGLQTGVTNRVKINERNFNGSYVEVKGSGDPFIKTMDEQELNSKFDTLRPTYAIINLISERNLHFIGLFSQDDRKFRVDHERPAGTLVWRGFIQPSVFNEEYVREKNYVTTIKASDNLESLSTTDFLDKDGNKVRDTLPLVEVCALILAKLDLELSIRIGANISEDSHNQVNPFEATEINCTGFYEDDGTPWNCARVLRALLMPFGARLVQEDGYWNIVRVEEQTDTYDVRIYDKEGAYQSATTYNPVRVVSPPSQKINAIFANANQVLEMVPAYGKITVKHNLYPKPSLLKSYGFEASDIIGDFFDGWLLDLTNGTGIAVNRKEVVLDPTALALNNLLRQNKFKVNYGSSAIEFRNFSGNESTGGKYAILTSDAYPVQFYQDAMSLSFKYRMNAVKLDRFGNPVDTSTIRSYYGFPFWTRIRFSIKLGSYYYNKVVGWSADADFEWNDIWENRYNEDLSFEINSFSLPQVTTPITLPVVVKFWIEGGNTTDAQSEAELGAIVTADTLPEGHKVKVYNSGSYYYYVLRNGTQATSYPTYKRPDDYAASTNECYWEAEGSVAQQFPIDAIYLDDVFLNFLPNFQKPPTVESIPQVVNANFKEELEVEIDSGDLPDSPINSKQFIYNAYFEDEDGNFTSVWSREAVSEQLTVQKILLKSLINQYRYPTFKLNGSMIGFSNVGFLTTLKHTEAAPAYALTNEEFTGSATGWSNGGSGTSWAYDSNDVQVTLTGAVNSKNFLQALSGVAGRRISITFELTRSGGSGFRGDWFCCVLLSGGSVVQEVVLDNNIQSDGDYTATIKFSIANDFDKIGFYVRNIAGTGSAVFDVTRFALIPLSIVRYFTPNALSVNERHNLVDMSTWMQLIPVVFSSDPTIDDSGEGNTDTEGGGGQGTGGGGSSYSGDYNDDYGNDFDTILN